MPCSPSLASNDLAYISSRLLGLPIVLKTSESIRLSPVFAFVCYVSIHPENFCDGGASDAKWKLEQESTVAGPQSPTRPVFVFSPQSLPLFRCDG
jgi:hypothetical protein